MFDYYEGYKTVNDAWIKGLKPDPKVHVSEWSDRYRILSSKASSEPGRWSTARTPYLKEIMDCLSPMSKVERIVFMKCAQVGGTECGNNWIGYCIHLAPGPMMVVSPTVELAKRNSKQRIDPLIEDSKILSKYIAPSRSRDSGNTILVKEFRGGVLIMTGANSAVGLRSMPVRYLFLDEVDGYPSDVDDEGDAVQLAEARTRTFSRRKIFIVSTPKIAGASKIESEYEASDKRRYFVPCPYCGHSQYLRFEQLEWKWGKPETAHYICESCKESINESHKTKMLSLGEWKATNPNNNNNGKTRGFHLSALYSPVGWRSWSDIAGAWEGCQKSSSKLKSFKNIELGETWVEKGDSPDWEYLIERLEDYDVGTVPEGGLMVTCGVDIQKDRIEASIWAFGRGKESWLIEHRVFLGDTAKNNVWDELYTLLNETWTTSNGIELSLSRIAIDTGYATQYVYSFIRKSKDSRVMAVKGVARGSALLGIPTAVDVNINGKRMRRGIKVFSVTSSIAKLELYNNLRKTIIIDEDTGEISFPEGYVHLPKVDVEFVKQICAEQLVTRYNRNGFPVREWEKMRDRNEALDCYVYARAAACFSGLDRFEERHWGEFRRQIIPDEISDESYEQVKKQGNLRSLKRGVVKSPWINKL